MGEPAHLDCVERNLVLPRLRDLLVGPCDSEAYPVGNAIEGFRLRPEGIVFLRVSDARKNLVLDRGPQVARRSGTPRWRAIRSALLQGLASLVRAVLEVHRRLKARGPDERMP